MKPIGTKTLTTPRLLLRAVQNDDAEALVRIHEQRHLRHIGDAFDHGAILIDGEQVQIGDTGVRASEVAAGDHDHFEAGHLGGPGGDAVKDLLHQIELVFLHVLFQSLFCHTY